LEKRNNNLKEGKEDFYVYRYLSQLGFLPNYAFPSKVTSVRMLHKGEEEEISRGHAIAIREFAPLNTIYYGGLKYVVQTVSKEVDPTNKFMAVVCEDCEHVEKLGAGRQIPSNCPNCGSVWESQTPVSVMKFPKMRANKRNRITADEEERLEGGYKIIHSYKPTGKAEVNEVIRAGNSICRISFERSGEMNHLNLGQMADYNKGDKGFMLDTVNLTWVPIYKFDEYLVEKRLTAATESDVLNDFETLEITDLARTYSPNEQHLPFYADLPYQYVGDSIVVNDSVLKKWEDNFPINMIEKHINELKNLYALKLDWGRNDQFSFIPATCLQFSKKLDVYGVEHFAEEYNGDHGNKLGGIDGRIYTELLPFFNSYLNFARNFDNQHNK